MELTATGRVVLGMLGLSPMSGYEIKQRVDRSTRFFWTATYGQLYPELRRLADAGLIESADGPQGGRRRTVHRLTDEGRRVLDAWLAAPADIHEMRSESLLKLFFADAAGPGAATAQLEAMERRHRETAARLREIEAAAGGHAEGSTYVTLRFGIAFNDWAARWCAEEAGRA